MRSSLPFGYLRRPQAGLHHVLEIQLDKRGRASFVLNAGIVPPEGVTFPWGHFTQGEASVSGLREACRLYRSTHFMSWFSAPLISWPPDPRSRAERAASEAISLYPEVENWFLTRALGPHLRPLRWATASTA